MKDSREYELKLELTEDEADRIRDFLVSRLNVEIQRQEDTYYCPAEYDVRRYMERKCVRVRSQNEIYTLDYKEIINEESVYVQKIMEYSTQISDPVSVDEILKHIGFRRTIVISKERVECRYKNKYKIALDYVRDLGWFLEIELLECNADEAILEEQMRSILQELNVIEIRINKKGYSNMMLDVKYGEGK